MYLNPCRLKFCIPKPKSRGEPFSLLCRFLYFCMHWCIVTVLSFCFSASGSTQISDPVLWVVTQSGWKHREKLGDWMARSLWSVISEVFWMRRTHSTCDVSASKKNNIETWKQINWQEHVKALLCFCRFARVYWISFHEKHNHALIKDSKEYIKRYCLCLDSFHNFWQGQRWECELHVVIFCKNKGAQLDRQFCLRKV